MPSTGTKQMSERSTKFCVLGTMSLGSFPGLSISGDLGELWSLSPPGLAVWRAWVLAVADTMAAQV